MSNQNEWTRDQSLRMASVIEATVRRLIRRRSSPDVFQLGVGLTRAAPYPHQRLKNRFISKASLRQSM